MKVYVSFLITETLLMLEFFASSVKWIPYPLAAVLVAMLGTRLCISILPRFGLIDLPRGRHQHERAVPRGGGIAIILAFFISMTLVIFGNLEYPLSKGNQEILLSLGKFAIAAVVLGITGILDDKYELRSIVKLIVQIVIGCFFYWTGCGIHCILDYSLPWFVGMPLTVCWVIGIINAFNLIDGLDGIAAGLASIASFSLAVWGAINHSSALHVVILLVFCGSCLGFLRYNFSPARIFMGDTGSMFLGLFFAFTSMSALSKAVTMTSLLVPLIAIGIPIFDVFLAIWRRFFRRYIKHDTSVSIMEGDHDHLHHRIMKEQGSQRKTAYIIYSLATLLSLIAMGSVFLEQHLPALVFVLFLIAIFTFIRYAHIEILDTVSCVAKGFSVPHKNFILTAIHPVIDCILVSASFFAAVLLFPPLLYNPVSLYYILIFVGPFTACLCISGIYQTFWLRAGISQYYKLIRLCIFAGAIGFTTIYLLCAYKYDFSKEELQMLIIFYLLFFFMACALISGERFLLRYLESFGFRKMYIQSRAADKKTCRTMIYGGGLFCRLYLTNIFSGPLASNKPIPEILGIIDDDFVLHHLSVYGFQVLGGIDDMEEIYQRKPFDRLVIALRNISEERKQQLVDFAKTKNVEVQIFTCSIDELNAKVEQ